MASSHNWLIPYGKMVNIGYVNGHVETVGAGNAYTNASWCLTPTSE